MGGLTGCEPLAISKVSNASCSPPESVSVRFAASTDFTLALRTAMRRSSKWVGLLRR